MKPVYCHKCGRKLRTLVSHKYDEMTGEKLVDSTSMDCPKSIEHTMHLYVDGEWRRLW